MSLRGSEATEAISQGDDISEIATLPAVARNDRKGIATQSPPRRGEGRVRGLFVKKLNAFVLIQTDVFMSRSK